MQATLAAAQTATQQVAWSKSGVDSIVAGDGITIAIVGILVVFASLTIIALVITLIRKASGHRNTSRAQDAERGAPVKNGVSGEIVAAIAIALEQHLFEVHDEERTILTINKVSKPYSPWSSKLYGMTPRPKTLIIKP